MKIKNLWLLIASCALLSLLAVGAFAQVGRIEGDVVKSGTGEPIVDAQVDIVRTDIKGNYTVKTNKKGEFLHAGVPFVGTYTLLVSASGFAPTFLVGIRPDRERLKVELMVGDGRKLTIDDVKKAGSGAPAAGAAPKVSEADAKKAKEEYEKALKEREEAEKYNTSIGQINTLLQAGQAAMDKKDYNGAITSFSEAVKLNPTIHISQGNLGIALQKRAVAKFNAGERDSAKEDFVSSIDAMGKALEGLDFWEKDPKQKNDPAQNKNTRRTYYVVKAESEGILATKYYDGAQAEAAVKDYQALSDLTDDPAKKKEYLLKGAKVLYDAGNMDAAIASYKSIIETDPDNIEALYWLGLAYTNKEETWQVAANTLQTFINKAPQSDNRVAEAQSVIGELLKGNKIEKPKPLDDKKRASPARKKP